METLKHRRQMNLLCDSLELGLADRDDVFIGGNMFMYFSEVQIKKNDFCGPDVFVVLNSTRRSRKSWVVWKENFRTPDVVIELTSESTEHIDRGDKMRIYSKMLRVTNYFIFDPIDLRFDGFELDPQKGVYKPIKPAANGDIFCSALGLFLGVRKSIHVLEEDDWLRWIDKNGQMILNETERRQAAREEARAAQENARIAQENERVAQENARIAQENARIAQEHASALDQRLAEALAELEKLKAQR